MNLENLTKMELDQHLKTLVLKERQLLHQLLFAIQLIEKRKIYLDMGYASLFLYLTEEVKYSRGSAQRRIDAAKLLSEIPKLGEKIESGEINLGHLTLVQKAVRDVYRNSARVVGVEDKAAILGQLPEKDFYQAQKEVAAFFDLPVIEATQIKVQADDSRRIEMTVSNELYEKIQRAQGLLSHATKDAQLVTYLEYVTDQVIKQKTAVRVPSGTKNVDQAKAKSPKFTQRTKKIILNQQRCCQYVDPKTQRQCRSNWFLQTDHRQSVWAGGDGSVENGQLLCAVHNRLKYQREAGIQNV